MGASGGVGETAAFEFVEHCATALLDFLPVDNAAFYLLDEDFRPSVCHALRSTPSFQADAYVRRLWRNDPLLPATNVPGEPVRTLTRALAEQRESQFSDYLAFIKREGCIDTLKVDFSYKGRIIGGVAMGRRMDAGHFHEDEVSLLRKCYTLLHLAGSYGEGQSREETSIKAFKFTPREAEIVALIRRGATNKEIAFDFDIGVATVKSHLINMFEKAGVRNRTGLLAAVYP